MEIKSNRFRKRSLILPHPHNGRSEDEQLSVKATSGNLLVPLSITRSYQATGPAGRVICLQRCVIVTVPFLDRARDDRREGSGHGSRDGVEVETNETRWNPWFGRGPFSPSFVGFFGNVLLVMRTTGSIICLIPDGCRGRLTSLRSVR